MRKALERCGVIVATGRRLEWKRSVVSRGRRWNDASKKNRYERRSIFLCSGCVALPRDPDFCPDRGEIYRAGRYIGMNDCVISLFLFCEISNRNTLGKLSNQVAIKIRLIIQ